MAHHSRCDTLSDPVKIGPVTAMNPFFRSHIATEWAEACLINLSYFFIRKVCEHECGVDNVRQFSKQ